MPFSPSERQDILSSCVRFLGRHHPRTVREQLHEIVDSPYADLPRDGYGSGGFVTELEGEVAGLLGKEAAVIMPSGTMAQQIALRIWCDRGKNRRIAFHPTCHLQIHEQMAYRELHGLEAILVGESTRLFNLDDLRSSASGAAALLIELPQREIGGQLPTWEELIAQCAWAKTNDIRLHMDGARLWECSPYYQRSYAEISAPFDSVYVSFYKVLDGLPGAALAGPSDFIAESRIWLRRHGGNLHQQSANAIAAKLGMERHLPRIPDYVRKAGEVAQALSGRPGITIVPEAPPTNMMHVYLEGDKQAMEDTAWQVARDTKTFLFGSLAASERVNVSKLELSIGDGALALDPSDVGRLFDTVIRAGAPAAAR